MAVSIVYRQSYIVSICVGASSGERTSSNAACLLFYAEGVIHYLFFNSAGMSQKVGCGRIQALSEGLVGFCRLNSTLSCSENRSKAWEVCSLQLGN